MRLWLLTPIGARFSQPSYGNPLYALLEAPIGPDTSDYVAMVQTAASYFLATQAADAQMGYLSADERLSAITDITATYRPPQTVAVSLTVHARNGTSLPTAFTLGV